MEALTVLLHGNVLMYMLLLIPVIVALAEKQDN